MVNFFNMDCVEFMKSKPDKCYDLAIIDPPYGINMAMGHKGSEKRGDKNKYKSFAGNDNEIPTPEYFEQLFRVSKNQIIWGGNYMIKYLEPTPCFIVWDKVQPEAFSMAMCEIAWTSFKSPAKIFKKRVVGADDVKIHPTQKSIELYRWLLQNYAKPNDKILDTHGGSMSSAIACDMDGYSLDICEIDSDYFNAGVKRFENYKRQGVLFAPEQIKPEQIKLIL